MRVSLRSLAVLAALGAGAAPAGAAVSLVIDGSFIQGSDAVRQAVGDPTLNARFSAGLLLTIDTKLPTTSFTFERRNFYAANSNGVIQSSTPWWGYATDEKVALQSSTSVVFDHDRSDAGDPSYPLWTVPTGNGLMVLFDWGVVPDTLRFDLASVVQQERRTNFRGVTTNMSIDPTIWIEENIASTQPPSRMENGTIGCTSTEGSETETSPVSFIGFRPKTYERSVSTTCSVSIDVRRFLPVVQPPVTDPVGAVPEPASWAMMIGGFGLVGGAMRRRARTVRLA